LFKTEMCRSYLKNDVCFKYGVYCAKAHDPTEIRNLVVIYGEDWKRHYDLPMKERYPDSLSIIESEPSIEWPKSVSNCYTCQIQGANSQLRIPKLAPVRRVESFNNHSSYISSPHLHGIYDSLCYHMPEFFFEPVKFSNSDLCDEIAEIYEGCIDYTYNCESPVNYSSECSLYSIPTIS
jgi:hypothetical protein